MPIPEPLPSQSLSCNSSLLSFWTDDCAAHFAHLPQFLHLEKNGLHHKYHHKFGMITEAVSDAPVSRPSDKYYKNPSPSRVPAESGMSACGLNSKSSHKSFSSYKVKYSTVP